MQKKNKEIKPITQALVWSLLMLFATGLVPTSDTTELETSSTNNTENNVVNEVENKVVDDNETKTLFGTQYTPITEFYCDLDELNKTIVIKEYDGNRNQVIISDTYNIDGEDYNVIEITDDACFLGASIESVAFKCNITSIPNNTFNSTTAERIYIPKSVADVTGMFGYMHDLKSVYYEGTEAEWKKIKGTSSINENVLLEFEYVLNVDNDNTNYSKEAIVTEKSNAEELGENMAEALNGFLKGVSDYEE